MTIASAMARQNEVQIVLISDMECPALNSYRGEIVRLEHESSQCDIQKLATLAHSEKADVLHSFDANSHLIAKAASAKTGIPLVETKPGGQPCRRTYPFAYDITVFTLQDHDLLLGHPSFRKANIHLIPNRVERPPVNTERLRLLSPHLKDDHFKFILISTLVPVKAQIFHRCLNLIDRLNGRGIKTQAIIIANPHDQAVHDDVCRRMSEHSCLLTTKEYTTKAAEFIPAADAAISMGRSTMESTAFGKPVLCGARNLDIPYLLDESNIENAIRHNFTDRATASISESDALNAIAKMIISTSDYQSACQFSEHVFSTYCDVEKAVPLYQDIYRTAKPAKNTFLEKERQTIALSLLGHATKRRARPY
ncbi:MAG: hypothetical protein Q7Q73_17825 [Verrucomicrobiota bacterium JB024]|nr:hypothetical protein [Verrucomicrobiota bacterium JB024]